MGTFFKVYGVGTEIDALQSLVPASYLATKGQGWWSCGASKKYH